MTRCTPGSRESADKLVTDLVNAFKRQCVAPDIIEPSAKIKVCRGRAHE